jgi:transcriptional regulator with XRE-family HTH domain
VAKKAVNKALRSGPGEQTNGIGARAKALRLHRRLTLDNLAEVAGLSKGHLSRFERGQKSLSLAMLIRLAGALQSSVAELFGELPAAGQAHLSTAEGRIFRKASAADGGHSFAALSRGNDPLINAFVVEFGPNTEFRQSAEAYHRGEEIFFVLEGALEIELGTHKQLLNEGDYMQFPGSVKHNIRSVRKHSRALVVVVQR